jgi:uncharacterized protein (DUF2249 family)
VSDAITRADLEVPLESLQALNLLLIRALKALHAQGQGDAACRIAAEAWKAVRESCPPEADRLTGALHFLVRPTRSKEKIMSEAKHLDVRELPPPQRHALIFQTCGDLGAGDAIVLVNDHDPKPLYYQFQAEYPGRFGWEYIESGPEVWKVRITRKAA